MSQTDSQLLTEADIIKNETAAGTNTAGRIGTMYEDIINNKVNNLYTSSFVTNSQTGSFIKSSQTSSFVTTSQTSSFVTNAQTSSFLTTGITNTTQTISGSLTINQNLTVLGSSSIQYITSSQLNIGTSTITVNTATPAIRFGGLAVADSGSAPIRSGSMLFDSTNDQWIFVHQASATVTSSVVIMGPETYSNVGNETNLTTNKIPKSVNAEHIGDSNISDTGTVVSINSNTQVTGSLVVSAGITGSLQGTASLATTASYIAGYVLNSSTSSFVTNSQTSSFVTNSQTSSFVTNNQTGSFVTTSSFNSYTGSATSRFAGTASYATTASYALNGGGGGTTSTASLLTTASATGNTITFTKGDTTTFDVTVSGGTGAPGGSDTQIQFNSAGVFQGNTSFAYIYTSSSLQQGYLVSARGSHSHAQGNQTIASGTYSHAEGQNTLASNQSSHAEGASTVASGQGSHAEGQYTLASAIVAHSEGYYTTASGNYSHVEGYYAVASGQRSHAEGSYTVASNLQSHAEGSGSVASGGSSHAEGSVTIASAQSSHAEGEYNIASGQGSHAEGYFVTASGGYSHAEGEQTKAIGNTSHAEGYLTVASGVYSHAEGDNTKAKNTGAHAEGAGTAAHGTYSHAEGSGTVASGSYSHAEGENTIALDDFQHAQGTFNIATSGKAALIVGNGYYDYDTDIEYRSNLIYASGSILQVSGTLEINPNSGPNVINAVSKIAKFKGVSGIAMEVVISDENLTGGFPATVGSIGIGSDRLQIKYGPGSSEWADAAYNLAVIDVNLSTNYDIIYPGVYEIIVGSATSGSHINLPSVGAWTPGCRVTIINKTNEYVIVGSASGDLLLEGSDQGGDTVSAKSMTEYVSNGTYWRRLPSQKVFTYSGINESGGYTAYTKGVYQIATADGGGGTFQLPNPSYFEGESITIINSDNSNKINFATPYPVDPVGTSVTQVFYRTVMQMVGIGGYWRITSIYSV